MVLQANLERDGFAILRDAVSDSQRQALLPLVADPTLADVTHRSGQPFASRALLLRQPRLCEALTAAGLNSLASRALGVAAFPIDALFFDKHPKANWAVPAHQDRMFPIRETKAVKCFTRSGVTYGQPSAATLATLVALRLHFDAANESSGALGLLPGSHRRGLLSDDELRGLPLHEFQVGASAPGDVLFMRPLTVHRSSPLVGSAQRRVLHVVYASGEPDGELRWSSSA